jgi:uncharacterized surface protein with fasciclin (FAS1) repeats
MTLKTLAAASILAFAPLAVQAQTTAPAAATSTQATPAPAAAPAAAAQVAPSFTDRPVRANGDLVATLRADGRFTTLIKGLETTNLVDLLKKQPGLTLFAPTDAAFETLPAAERQTLMTDKAALQKLLVRHLINARVDSAKIKGARGPVPSVAGDNLMLDGSGEALQVDNAAILQTDVMASNGVLHVVDHVLQPGAAAAGSTADSAAAAN